MPARRPLSRALSSLLATALMTASFLPAMTAPAGAVAATQIAGHVRQPNGSPVAGATVFGYKDRQYPEAAAVAYTDGSGAYTLTLPGGGTYEVGAAEASHLGAFAGGRTIAAARRIPVGSGATASGADATLTPKPVTDVSDPGIEIASRALTRPTRKSGVRVAAGRALWTEGRNVMLGTGFAGGAPAESVLSTSGPSLFDINSSYAFLGTDRIDLSTEATAVVTNLDGDGIVGMSCDDSYVAYLIETEPTGVSEFPTPVLEIRDANTLSLKRRITMTGYVDAKLQPGGIANGRIAVAARSSNDDVWAVVYDINTGARLRNVPTFEEGSELGAVLAGDRLAWSTGKRAYVASMTSTPGTRTLDSVTGTTGRELGSLVAGGDRVVLSESTQQMTETDFSFINNTVKSFDLSTGASAVVYSDAAASPSSPSGSYDVSASDVAWLRHFDGDAEAPWASGEAKEVWAQTDTSAAQRIDTDTLAAADQESPMLSNGYLAYLDNDGYPTSSWDYDLKLRHIADPAATSSVVATGVGPAAGEAAAFGGDTLAYVKQVTSASAPWGEFEVWVYNVVTKARSRIEQGLENVDVRATGQWVVYESNTVGSTGSLPPTIRAYNTKTGARRLIYTATSQEEGTDYQVSNGVVVYTDSLQRTYAYDLATGARRAIAIAAGAYLGESFAEFDYPHYVDVADGGGFSAQHMWVGSGSVILGNAVTGERFAVDPLAEEAGLPTGRLSGRFAPVGGMLFDITSGEFYRLPLDEASSEAIDGNRVAAATYDEPTDSYTIRLFDLTHDVVSPTDRKAGTERVQTAGLLSHDMSHADAVVLATSRNYPDALAGGPLAYALGAPVLLTDPTGLSPAAKAEIVRLGAKKAYVLGGTGAVSSSVDIALGSMGVAVERVKGANRFDTAKAIATKLRAVRGVPLRAAFIATGRNFPDALAAAPVAARMGAPILLTEQSSLPTPTAAALAAVGATSTTVLGSATIISNAVVNALPHPTRLYGNDRYETAAKLAKMGYDAHALDAHSFVFANGNDFPDALAAGSLAARSGVALLLVNRATPSVLPPKVAGVVSDHRGDLTDAPTIAGGEVAVPMQLQERIAQAVWPL